MSSTRSLHPAAILGPRAPRVEPAPGWRVDRRGQVPAQHDGQGLRGEIRVRDGNGRQQGRRIGVPRVDVDLADGADLDDFAEVHDCDAIAEVTDHGQVVGDEEVGESEVSLQARQEVDDLGLDAHVERGYWLVTAR